MARLHPRFRAILERDPEKWEPLARWRYQLRKIARQINKLGRDHDSKKSGHALAGQGRGAARGGNRIVRGVLRPGPGRYISRGLEGQVAEWLKAHAWKVCNGESRSRVRIPLCPPNPKLTFNKFRQLLWGLANRDQGDLEPQNETAAAVC